MILVDANLLLSAEDSRSPHHTAARVWWEAQLSGTDAVCLGWPTINAFLRIATNLRIYARPLTREEAVARVQTWLDQPCARIVTPTPDHWTFLQEIMEEGQATADLIPHAHLGALARGHACTLASTDLDFAKFPSVRWINPLGKPRPIRGKRGSRR